MEWLAMRQQPGGGSEWSSPEGRGCLLFVVGAEFPSVHQCHCTALTGKDSRCFILESQDVNGGIADRPGDVADLFHTFFGLAGLALLGEEGLQPIDPALCIPCCNVSSRVQKG